MAVSEATLDRAVRRDRAAIEAMLADVYPAVFRLAHALTGRPGAAGQVLHDVLRRSLRVMPKWRRGTVPENWYYHHTLITARHLAPGPPDPRDDVLVARSATPDDPAYRAFVRAIRSLPRQQAEAFLLHHGERLNTRLLGVAMDCSHAAAADHLKAADSAIGAVGGGQTAALTATLERAYASLVPPPHAIRPSARKYVAKHLRPLKVKRVLLVLAFLGVLVAAYFAWQARDKLMKLLPTPPASQPA
jgi:DNA-directed RNA polymerase specialized sigma24 family protein